MIDAPLVTGDSQDASIRALVAAFRRRAVPLTLVLSDDPPELDWELGGPLHIGGVELAPRAVFVRPDVFASPADPSPVVAEGALAWTAAISGYALATSTRMPNAAPDPHAGNKPAMLVLAAELGLAVPPTRITNARAASGTILRAPAILQPELVAPELRLFAVGDEIFAFEVRSPSLDYRTGPADVIAVEPPAHLVEPYLALVHMLGLDFCAADFKSARTGELLLLEVNAGPMFARFDEAAAGALTDALVDWLLR
ncbi:MAG TPA: hypothetical protein VGM88_11965 [Kofleriaceae bacterium]|jgi:hypothetical protein